MIKYLRKNQKKAMAIFAVFLMIAFALPATTSRLSGRGEVKVGTYGPKNTAIYLTESNQFQSEWKQLKDAMGGRIPYLQYLLGSGDPDYGNLIATQIDRNDEVFMLLVKEAQANGLLASDDLTKTWLQRIGVSPDSDAKAFARLYQPMRDLLTILVAADRAGGVYKVSQPERAYLRATQRQTLSLDLIEFSARDYLPQVPEPTDPQVQAQYDKYRSVDRESDPSGFGYHFPNRVKYDAVTIREDEVRKGIKPVELDEQMEYFLRNKNSEEFIATTQPAANSPDAFNIKPGPTTRPMTFKEAQEKIIKKLTDQRIAELTDKIRESIRNTMKADYEEYRAAKEAKKAVPPSSLGVPYDSFKYLQALYAKIQKDFNVSLTIEDNDHWTTPTMLADSDIGKYMYASGGMQVNLAQDLSQLAEPFLDEEARNRIPPTLKLAVWQPSQFFTNSDGNRVALARITAADPAHDPAKLEDVRGEVVNDVKLSMAYDKAKEAAKQAVDSARAGKWLASVAEGVGKKIIAAGPIRPPMMIPGYGMLPTQITGYALKGKAEQRFMKEAYGLLSQPERLGSAVRPAKQPATQPATRPAASTEAVALRDHPVGLIELPSEGKVLAAEVEEVTPDWTRDRQGEVDLLLAGQDRRGVEARVRGEWFDPENVRARLNWKAEQPKSGPKPQRPGIPPVDNPFLTIGM